MTRIEREKQTVAVMIGMYCRDKEGNAMLCPRCQHLQDYAFARLDHCPFGERKPSCKGCKVHCYKADMREHMRQVMRYAGPRMLFCHPLMAVRHLLDK